MRDPWKYVAFPAAAVFGFLLSETTAAAAVGSYTGLADLPSKIILVAGSGLISGFLVDEMIPAYLEKVRGSGGAAGDIGGGGDFGGGDDDFDFD